MNSHSLFEMAIKSSLALPSLCSKDYCWQMDDREKVSVFGFNQLAAVSETFEWKPYLNDLYQEYQHGARFGKFYERLVQVVLDASFGKSCVKSNIRLTHGEVDFLIQNGSELTHLEIAIKFYLQAPHLGLDFYGPNKQDSLGLKIKKMTEVQLQRPLESLTIESVDVSRKIHIPGVLFRPLCLLESEQPLDRSTVPSYINLDSFTGWWCREEQFDQLILGDHLLFSVPKLFRGFPKGAQLIESAELGICKVPRLDLANKAANGPLFCLRTDKAGQVLDRGFIVDASW